MRQMLDSIDECINGQIALGASAALWPENRPVMAHEWRSGSGGHHGADCGPEATHRHVRAIYRQQRIRLRLIIHKHVKNHFVCDSENALNNKPSQLVLREPIHPYLFRIFYARSLTV